MDRIILPFVLLLVLSCQRLEVVDVWYDSTSHVLSYGIERLSTQFDVSGHALERNGVQKGGRGLFILTPSAALNDDLGEVLYSYLPGGEKFVCAWYE